MAEEKIDPRKHRGFVGGEFTVTVDNVNEQVLDQVLNPPSVPPVGPETPPVDPETPPAKPEVLDTEGTDDTAKPDNE